MEGSHEVHHLFDTHSKPSSYSQNNQLISIAQDNQQIVLVDQQHLKICSSIMIPTKDRTLSLRLKDNLLVRGGNQGIINLWDIRQGSNTHVHSFNKPGSKIRALDLSQHILAAGSNKRMVFWDLRRMKQRCEFTESFNQEITGINFSKELPTIFHVCSMDGLIARFDLTQPNEEDAFSWGHQITESPCRLQLEGNITLLETDNQVLLTLQEESLKERYSVNSIENPTHILNSFLGEEQRIHYYTKAMKNSTVQYWVGSYNIGYVPTKIDIEMLIPLEGEKVIYCNADGSWYFGRVVKGTAKRVTATNDNFLTMEQLQGMEGKVNKATQEICNSNGFIISKPSTLKNHSKKFKPY